MKQRLWLIALGFVCGVLLSGSALLADTRDPTVIKVVGEAGLSKILTDHEKRLAKLEGANLSKRIEILSEKVAALTTRVWDLEARLKSSSAKTERLDHRVDATDARVGSVRKSVETLGGKLKALMPLIEHIDVSKLTKECAMIFRWNGSSFLTLASKKCPRVVAAGPDSREGEVLSLPPDQGQSPALEQPSNDFSE